MLLWSGNSLVGRAVREDIPPLFLAFVRWSSALLVIAPFALRRVRSDLAVIREKWTTLLFLGLSGIAVFSGLLYTGLHHTTAANALLLQALIPALVLIAVRIMFGERATTGQIVGVGLSTAGVLVIVFHGDVTAVMDFRVGLGDALILLACLSWAIYTAGLRLTPRIHWLSYLFVTFAIGAAVMGLASITEIGDLTARIWKPANLAALAYVAVFPSIIAYVLYSAAVARLGAGTAGLTNSLMPLFGAVLAQQLLGEKLEPFHAAGMLLILGALALTAWLRWRAEGTVPA